MFSRKFQCDKLVMIVGEAVGRKRLVADRVVTGMWRGVICFSGATNFAVSLEIQTKFEAARMKGAAPVEIARHPKIVPFDGHAHRIDIAVKRTPTVFHFAPGVLFGSALRTHRVQITNVAARNARKVSFPPRSPGPSYPAARPHHTCFEQNRESHRREILQCALRRRAKRTRGTAHYRRPRPVSPSLPTIPSPPVKLRTKTSPSALHRRRARNQGCSLPANTLPA